MNHVIRRSTLILTVLVALFLSACAGGSADALRVGERTISHEGLAQMVSGINGGPATEVPQTVSADQTRAVGNVWIVDAAAAEYLRAQGIEIDAAARTEAETFIAQAVADGQIGDLPAGSEGYEALVNNIWISGQLQGLQAQPEAEADITVLIDEAWVSSNIGVWDSQSGQILPPVLGD
jgi:uncharacterized protein YqfA (UPF0365 family)